MSLSTARAKRANLPTRAGRYLREYGPLWILALPALALLVAFSYVPMAGLVIVFKDYNFLKGIWGSPWVGLKNFEFFFYNMGNALRATKNTLFLNALNMFFSTLMSISLAIMFSEIRSKKYLKVTQTISIFPHFLSWAVVGGIATAFLSYDKGMINGIIAGMGGERLDLYNTAGYWPAILTIFNVWKGSGYSAIVYYATISGFDTSYFEAAEVDGATLWQRIIHITIPMLAPTICILTLMSVGRIFYGDLSMMMSMHNLNPMLYETTDIIDTFVYRSITQLGDYSMSSAVSLYQSLFGFVLVLLSNYIVGKFSAESRLF
ncbi:MAG: sugar ABC transporter permease [Clostridia bacterium]|nr:sugar ABC transporter permease [Clostridia bacterium]